MAQKQHISSGVSSWRRLWDGAPIVSLDELPRHTPWVDRVHGRIDFHCPPRNEREVVREYEVETYGPQLQLLKNLPDASYTDLFRASYPHLQQLCCAKEGEFRVLTPYQAYEVQLGIFQEALSQYAQAPALVEIGAGNGRLMASFAKEFRGSFDNFIALEPMPSGRAIVSHMSRDVENLITADCDICSNPFTSATIPQGAVIYTSWVIYLFPHFNAKSFLNAVFSLHPRAVLFFEPVYEMLEQTSPYDVLVQKYIDINNYNKDFYSELLQDARFEIVKTKKHAFGNNPLFPCSIIECVVS